jgi:hypothetical protein
MAEFVCDEVIRKRLTHGSHMSFSIRIDLRPVLDSVAKEK